MTWEPGACFAWNHQSFPTAKWKVSWSFCRLFYRHRYGNRHWRYSGAVYYLFWLSFLYICGGCILNWSVLLWSQRDHSQSGQCPVQSVQIRDRRSLRQSLCKEPSVLQKYVSAYCILQNTAVHFPAVSWRGLTGWILFHLYNSWELPVFFTGSDIVSISIDQFPVNLILIPAFGIF